MYTWGLGEYGRLGHGDTTTHLKPKLVEALVGQRIVQVACGSRDAQTMALTEDGSVYSWGDGDFGKLAYIKSLYKVMKNLSFCLIHR